MSEPRYHTIGYPVKVFKSGAWAEGMICDAYRYSDDAVSVLTMEGIVVLYGDSLKEGLLKPNIPDDNPWIPVAEQWPKANEYRKLWITEKCPAGIHTIKGIWCHNQFKNANGMPMKFEAIAWKPYIPPEPYKEVSEEP